MCLFFASRLQLYSAYGHHGARLLCELRIPGHKFLCCFQVNACQFRMMTFISHLLRAQDVYWFLFRCSCAFALYGYPSVLSFFLLLLLLVVNLPASVQVLIESEAMIHAAGVCVVIYSNNVADNTWSWVYQRHARRHHWISSLMKQKDAEDPLHPTLSGL